MTVPRLLVLTLLVASPALTGCVDVQGEFALVSLGGRVVGVGPEYRGAHVACGSPLPPEVALDVLNGTLWASKAAGELPGPFSMLVVDGVGVQSPASAALCPRRPSFHADDDGRLMVSVPLHGHAVEVEVKRQGRDVLVDGNLLKAGMVHTMPVAFVRTIEQNQTYEYEGEILVAFHGLWSASAIQDVPGPEQLRGRRGYWR